MQRLIRETVLRHLRDPGLARLEDAAYLEPSPDGAGSLAFTTDSYVVDPLFFPGGDIGKLAVCGTVNDLAVSGARPRYLSLALIIEEGLELEVLDRVLDSIGTAAAEAGVAVVCGDTKVVPRGAADRLFINTSGIGTVPAGLAPGIATARPGDAVLVSGDIARHGAAILAAREELHLSAPIVSDCADLSALAAAVFEAADGVRCLRDATRGGVAAVLNELAEASACAVRIEEPAIPLDAAVQGLCELLGLDPLHLASEGCLIAVVDPSVADDVVAAMRAQETGRGAAQIGVIEAEPAGRVRMRTGFGGDRIVDMLAGEPLPRIC